MRNCFIADRGVLNTNMSVEEIELRVQKSSDEYASGMAQFTVKEISEEEVRIFFVGDFDYDSDAPITSGADMVLASGVGIGAPQPQQVGGYSMIYPLSSAGKNSYTGITSFIRFYKFQLFGEMGRTMEHIGLRCYPDRILMQIVF